MVSCASRIPPGLDIGLAPRRLVAPKHWIKLSFIVPSYGSQYGYSYLDVAGVDKVLVVENCVLLSQTDFVEVDIR